VALRFPKDLDSPQGGRPSLRDDGNGHVIQGQRVTDAAVLSAPLRSARQEQVPAGETLIRFPKRLMHMFPELNGGR
jgi:hypothetical protein